MKKSSSRTRFFRPQLNELERIESPTALAGFALPGLVGLSVAAPPALPAHSLVSRKGPESEGPDSYSARLARLLTDAIAARLNEAHATPPVAPDRHTTSRAPAPPGNDGQTDDPFDIFQIDTRAAGKAPTRFSPNTPDNDGQGRIGGESGNGAPSSPDAPGPRPAGLGGAPAAGPSASDELLRSGLLSPRGGGELGGQSAPNGQPGAQTVSGSGGVGVLVVGPPLLAVGADAGDAPRVKVYDARTRALKYNFLADKASFAGGVRVAGADVTGDGTADIITGTGAGGNRVRVFDGTTGNAVAGRLGGLQAFTASESDGVFVAGGDVNADGRADLIVGSDGGGQGLLRVFSGRDGSLLRSVTLGGDLAGGVRVAAGDVNADGRADVVAAAGPGGLPRVRVLDGGNGAELFNFFAGDPTDRAGLYVAAGDLDGDGRADIVTGSGGGGEVRVFGPNTASAARVALEGPAFAGGTRVAVADADGDGLLDVAAGSGPGGGLVRLLRGGDLADLTGLSPFGAGATTGLFVGAGGGAGGGGGGGLLDTLPVVTIQAGADAAEAGTVQGSFTLTRTGDTTSGLTVSVMVGGTATYNTDYTIPSTTVNFAAGSATATLTVTPIDDTRFEGPETLTATIVPFWPYEVGTPDKAAITIVDNDSPTPVVADDCFCAGPTDLIGRQTGLSSSDHGLSDGGVRASDGTIAVAATDLGSSGFGGWGLARSWSNDPGLNSNGAGGNGVAASQLPFLRKDATTGTVVAASNAGTVRYFDSAFMGMSFTARHHLKEALSYSSGTGRYTLTDSTGARLVFFDFSTSLPAAKRGQLESYTDPAGNVTSVTSWTTGGQPEEVQASSTVGSTTVTESYLYGYVPSGTNAGKVASATLRRRTGAGAWSTVRTVEYTYYDTGSSNGNPGDLQLAVTKDAGGTVLDRQYYRYYTSSSSTGYQGGLKYQFGMESYGRLLGAFSDPTTATDAQVDDYADVYLEYDAARRVTKSVVQGAGCSACTGGLGTYSYAYATSTFADGYNSWRMKQTTTLPDGNQKVVYTNFAGQVMLEAFTEGGNTWLTFHKYDSNGRLVLTASPSAVSGYDETKADLLDNVSGNYTHLRDSAGLIETVTYATTTTATSSTAGNVAGYAQQAAIQRGETGTSVQQSAVQYLERTSGATIYVVANETHYRNTNGTGGQTTSAAYTWRSGTVEAESVALTLPTVTTAQNGPGTADTQTQVMDRYGRVIWQKDGAGYLHYTAYDQATGGIVKTITDVNTAQTGDFADLPSGWATPTGGGLHLVTTYEVDHLGRATKATAANGNVTYTVYNDASHEVRVYRGWDAGANAPTGPTEVYREDRAGGYTESLTMSATPTVSGGRPTGQESIGSVQTLSRSYTNSAGQVTHTDEYFNLTGLTYSTSTTLGTENTHYYRTRYGYDQRGRQNMVKSPTGTIARTVYDGLGRPASSWVGTNDTGATNADPTGGGASGNNMVKVAESQYDGGGVGDGNLTQTTAYPGGGAAARVSQFVHDWRNRLVASKDGVEGSEGTSVNRPVLYTEYDNLGQAVAQEQYDGDAVTVTDGNGDGVPDRPSSSLLRAKTVTSFDEQGRAYRTQVYSVSPSNGAVSSSALTSDVWFDRRGMVIKTSEPGGLVTKSAYDGAGRLVKSYATDGGGDSAWSDADDVTGDAVLEQAEFTYDAAGNVLARTTRQRFHDEAGTGELGTPATGVKARVSYVGMYYDKADRLTDSVDVGTNAGSAWTRPSSVPSRSDVVLVNSQAYNAAGWVESTTDPRGIVNKTYYDNLGRVVKTIEAYADGTPSNADDKTVEYTYDGAGHTLTLKAHLAGGGYQTTEWVYGVSSSMGSDVASNDVLRAVKYPDKTSGDPSSSEQESYAVNALGEVKTKTDRIGTVHTYSRDVLGRLTADAVTTLGSGVDGAIRRLETAYDTQGNAYLFTSYDADAGGNVVNQVQREYNGLGQMTREYQAVAGAVNTGSTPYVAYAYSEMASGANHSRLTSMTYPNGKVLTYNYASGLDNTISRLSSLSDTSGTLESYSYLGLGTVVVRAHAQPGVDLTYVKQSGEGDGDAGDQYAGLDRFGRVVDQRWRKTSDGSHAERLKYGYDRDSNRLYRDNVINSVFSELYHANGASNGYDPLGQLAAFRRGALSDANSDGVPDTVTTASRTQEWAFDALGNWASVTTDGSTQTRNHNKQNQITSISGLTTPAYDANGNQTGDEQGNALKYDSWGRLVEVKQGTTVLASYQHDALNRRVKEGSTRALYYSAEWQVVEERESGVAVVQSVFSPVYVDALVLRDRDTDANGSLEERLWVVQDANFNVTALLDGTGAVVERFVYDPYGSPTVLTAAWGARTASLYAWVSLHQGGRFQGATGLYDFRNRWLSSALGRWGRNDPIQYAGGDWNLYRDAGNRPTSRVDPNGLAEIRPPTGNFWFNTKDDKIHEPEVNMAQLSELLRVNVKTWKCEEVLAWMKYTTTSLFTRASERRQREEARLDLDPVGKGHMRRIEIETLFYNKLVARWKDMGKDGCKRSPKADPVSDYEPSQKVRDLNRQYHIVAPDYISPRPIGPVPIIPAQPPQQVNKPKPPFRFPIIDKPLERPRQPTLQELLKRTNCCTCHPQRQEMEKLLSPASFLIKR